MVKRAFFICTILAVMAILVQGGFSQVGQAASPATLQGTFFIVWGDGAPGTQQSTTNYYLTVEQNHSVKLLISDDLLASLGGALGFNRSDVVVSGTWHEVGESLIVGSIVRAGGQTGKPQGVFGPQPWVSIMCKFPDVLDEPNDLAFFKTMYRTEYPGLDHFWRQNSYDLVNVEGSDAYGWFVLPHERAYYFDADGNFDLYNAADDCTGVADPTVDFNPFVGINLMFNTDLGCCAYGGGWYLCLDGKCEWRMTWEPPWGYQNIVAIAHETGHGFGLPHSLGNCKKGYDNRWDVMSDIRDNGIDPDYPEFGKLGQHTIAYHKEMLEWISTGQVYTATTGTIKTITLERLALPQTGDYLEAKILIDNSLLHFYTLEVRQPTDNPFDYDKKLPGFAVIIHDVIPPVVEPAVLIDEDDDCDTSDDGAMYVVGEEFVKPNYGISVSIDATTDTGYIVTINNRFTQMDTVEITGPQKWMVGESIPLTATVSPANATIPITYTWEATGLGPVENVGGTFDSTDFTWDEPGSKLITVTASNAGGSVVDTHNITVSYKYPIVSVDGPKQTEVGVENTFTAASWPPDVSLPVTYTWIVDDLQPIIHIGGVSDTLDFTWDEPGVKLVRVTAENINGSSTRVMPVLVRMAPQGVEVSGVEAGKTGDGYEFSAAVLPITTTVPITYVWTVDGAEPITHIGGITDTLVARWDVPGMHHVSVQASNPAGSVAGDWSVMIYIRVFIPLNLRN